MIVKCQKPLAGLAQVLVYNKDRTFETLVTYDESWEIWFGEELKKYARAHFKGTILIIGREVRNQAW